MCKISLITSTSCGHQGYLPASACTSGFSSTTNRCNDNSHLIRYIKPRTPHDSTHCCLCYHARLDCIIHEYTSQYLQLAKDAEDIGWSEIDIAGSRTDIEIEMSEAIKEFQLQNGRDEYFDTSGHLQEKATLLALFSANSEKPSGEESGRYVDVLGQEDEEFVRAMIATEKAEHRAARVDCAKCGSCAKRVSLKKLKGKKSIKKHWGWKESLAEAMESENWRAHL